MRNKKSTLLKSIIALVLCVAMLMGTTYAWFTDSVESGLNTIAAGNLDVELLANGKQVTSTTKLFDDVTQWEPGVVVYENLQVVNKGNLALKYQMTLNFGNENNLNGHKLSEVLKVAVVNKIAEGTDRQTVLAAAKASSSITTLEDFYLFDQLDALQPDTERAVVIFWEPNSAEIDNLYNANNNQATSDGQPLHIEFGVKLEATQTMTNSEQDSFGMDYDVGAVFPTIVSKFKATADVTGLVDANNQLKKDVPIGVTNGAMDAIVPAGTELKPGVTSLVLTVETTDRSGNIELVKGQVSRSLDVHIEGISENNTVPATIDLGVVMPADMKAANIRIYHVENQTPVQMTAVDTLTAHNQFTYNAETGEMSVNMATFSEVTAVVTAGDPWTGEREYDWYTNPVNGQYIIDSAEDLAGFSAIVGGMAEGIAQDDFKGKTVVLNDDLDLGGLQNKVWYPVGYHNSTGSYDKQSGVAGITSNVSSFEGIFDGNNHTIFNIYQNTWDMFGDYNSGYSGTPNHYKDGMGLFGFVFNGTVKNLIVNNFQSDGEFCTTGVVAAYASGTSTFENISIVKSNPRAYNVPNGGVVGYAYNEAAAEKNEVTFNNISVDSSNKITALWGSWDVGCGGILGRVNGDTTINMNDCVAAAVIDVYNDVCGNYQYYQYRYAGTLIGTVGPDTDPTTGPEKVNFSNVTVYVGNWANYYFCEFEKNSQGSYTEDFQFSRVERNDINIDPATNLPYTSNLRPCQHQHTEKEDKMGLYLPFNQIYTGYGWGSFPVTAADGVTVIRHFYTVTYMNADGSKVLAVDYVTEGERSETKLWADAYTVKSGAISDNGNKIFKGWVNANSAKTETINAGNNNDIVLYESWDNPFTARFVDKDGNVVYAEAFHSGDTVLSEPEVPEVEGYVGEWEPYQTRVNALNGDVTIHPIYILKEYGGGGEHETVTDGLTAKLLFQYLAEGKSVVLGENLTADGKSLNINGGQNGLCEITKTTSRLNLNTYELTCDFSHNANKNWYVFELAQNSKLTVTGGVSGEGTLTMNLKNMNGGAKAYMFALAPNSTLVLEAGVTIEINYPTKNDVFGFAYLNANGSVISTDDFSQYDGIYVDKTTTPGVLRIIVGVTTTITAPTN